MWIVWRADRGNLTQSCVCCWRNCAEFSRETSAEFPSLSMEPIPNEVEKTKYRNSDQDVRHEEGPVVFWLFIHAEKFAPLIMPMLLPIRLLRTSRKSCSYRSTEQNSLKCSTANIFQPNKGNVLSLILEQKVLNNGRSQKRDLLCAVASERRRAKWKVKSESVGSGCGTRLEPLARLNLSPLP
jgi:hypothetical protein